MPLNIPPQAIDRWELSPLYELLEQGYTQRNVLGAAAHLRMVLTELHRQMVACAHATSSEAITESLRWMRKNLNRTVTLPELAAAAGLSIPHYSCLFKLATGFSPIEHFLRLRIQRACQLLDLTNLRVGEIAAEVGWSDPYYFSRAFRRIIGKSPRAYREVAMG